MCNTPPITRERTGQTFSLIPLSNHGTLCALRIRKQIRNQKNDAGAGGLRTNFDLYFCLFLIFERVDVVVTPGENPQEGGGGMGAVFQVNQLIVSRQPFHHRQPPLEVSTLFLVLALFV